METFKIIAKEKRLGFASNFMKKINIQDLNMMLIKFNVNVMNKDH